MIPNSDDDQKLRCAIECLPVHAHLCLLYETREEQFAAVVPFIRCGLARGYRCKYAADENTAADVLQELKKGGVDVDAALKSEALVIITKREAYLKEGAFSPDSTIALWRNTCEDAETDGFPAVSATGEMTWALGNEPGVEDLIEYEAKLNYFLPTCNIMVICQYNVNKFPSEIIHDVIYTHPLVIVGGDIYENLYYIPPDIFLASDREAAEVNYLISNLKSHSEDRRALQQANLDLQLTTERLRGERNRAEQYFSFAGVTMLVLATDETVVRINEKGCEILGYGEDDIVGKKWFDTFVPERFREEVRAVFRNLMSEEVVSVEQFVNPVVTSSGEERIIDWRNTVLYDEHGNIACTLSSGEDITERKRVEQEHLAHLWFFESTDKVNLAMQGTNDLEQMLSDVLDTTLSIFDCDRAWLLYPCDPEAGTWRVPMERTRPEYPGALARNAEIAMNPIYISIIKTLLESSEPVTYGPESAYPVPEDVATSFSVQSQILMAIYPKIGKPWLFGLHQCSYPRVWTPDEKRLFQEIGRRLSDSLSSLLTYRDLQEKEAELREAQHLSRIGSWQYDARTKDYKCSAELCRLLGLYPMQEPVQFERLYQLIHIKDRKRLIEAVEKTLRTGEPYEIEFQIVHTDGSRQWHFSRGEALRDKTGQIIGLRGVEQDITERKQAEEQLRKLNRTLKMLSEVNQILVRAADEIKLLEETCRIIADIGDYRMVWVGYSEPGADRLVLPVASAGYETGYLDAVKMTWADNEFGQGATGTAIRTGKPAIAGDIARDARYAPWREEAMKRGYASAMAIPLISGDQTLGALSLYSDQTDAFDEPEVHLLIELANDLAYGIYSLRTGESLRHSEERYRRVVEDQTEFIVRWKPDGRRTFVNDSYCRYHNLPGEELIGRDVFSLVLDEDRENICTTIKSLTPDTPMAVSERRVTLPDGSIAWQQWSDRAIFDDRGRVVEYQSVGRDITNLKNAQEELLKSELHKRDFHRRLILAATEGKLTLCDHEDLIRIAGPTMGTWNIVQPQDVSLIRNAIAVLAESAGMDDERIYNLSLCIGEATTNAYKHAGGGTASLHETPNGLLVVVSDHGPGIDAMSLPEVALVKGYSTAGTLGMGYKTIIALADKVYLATDSTGTTTGIEMALCKPELSPDKFLLAKTDWLQ